MRATQSGLTQCPILPILTQSPELHWVPAGAPPCVMGMVVEIDGLDFAGQPRSPITPPQYDDLSVGSFSKTIDSAGLIRA